MEHQETALNNISIQVLFLHSKLHYELSFFHRIQCVSGTQQVASPMNALNREQLEHSCCSPSQLLPVAITWLPWQKQHMGGPTGVLHHVVGTHRSAYL